jgi:flavin-dependent dehydrogenase
MSDRFDVIVIGAGPAGSTASALLAAQGHRVLVLEKDEFPRFKIGESLLPACLPILARLGIEPRSDTFVWKRGAQFVCEASGRNRSFAFEDALAGAARHAWHVDRARFDTLLRDRARTLGAIVQHGETVGDIDITTDDVTVTTRTQTAKARYVLDTSGQSRLLARRANAAVPYECFGRAAVFTHFEGLSQTAVDELGPHFDIRIMLRPDGWGWVIPLPDRRLSVGLVAKQKITPEELDSGLLSGPLVSRLTAGATRLETRIVGNFSYANQEPYGARFGTAGDAACFLDPVFSSGVTLAMHAADSVASVLGPALSNGTEAQPDLLRDHGVAMQRAIATFAGLIERFYNSKFAESVFLGDTLGTAWRQGVLSVLAGDVWRTGNPFQEMLLSARRRTSQPPRLRGTTP